MSHVATVETKIIDLDAFKVAVEKCGGELMLDQTTYAWWGYRAGGGDYRGRDPKDDGKCLHAVKVAGTQPRNGSLGPWEIGLLARRDGKPGFELEYDYYGGAGRALETKFGKGLATLSEEYGAEVAMRQLARAGFRTTRTDPLQTLR